MKQRIQWFFDINTSTDGIQFIDIRAGGEHIRQRLAGFFSMYRYFKLGSVNVKLVPASTLPVDPTGLSYGAGENTVNPVDQLNPGMFRITNGEKLQLDLTGMSKEEQMVLYNNLINDPRWFKFMLQRGASRRATPLYWNVGQFEQDIYPGQVLNLPFYEDDGGSPEGGFISRTDSYEQFFHAGGRSSSQVGGCSAPNGLFQTGRMPLGWLPTTTFESGGFTVHDAVKARPQGMFTPIPDINVMTIILPPALKTQFYYRCFVTEDVYFKEMIQANAALPGSQLIETRPTIDNFQFMQLYPGFIGPQGQSVQSHAVVPENDGGGKS